MCIYMYFACIYVYTCMPDAQRSQKRVSDHPETGVTAGCEPSCKC